MHCPVSELLNRMSSTELSYWKALNEICPLDPELRADLRHANLMCLLYNINRGKGKARKPKDFIVDWFKKPKKKQTWQDMQRFALKYTHALGGEVIG